MDHGPAVKLGVDHAAKRKTRLGIWMFAFYTIVYGVFVAIGVVNYEAMSIIVFRDINLVITYGFGLIALAIILGLIYNMRCTKIENEMNKEDKS